MFLKEKNIINDNVVLSHDGFMIQKQNYYDGLTEEINKHVLDTTGFNIKYVIKQMSESHNDIHNLSSVEIRKYY